MKHIFTLALAATTMVGLGACSSDTKSSIGKLTSPSDVSISSHLSLPSDLSSSSECQQLAMSFSSMMAQVMAPTGQADDIKKLFGDVSSKIPDDLKDDFAVMSDAFGSYAQLLKDHANDMTNPDVQKALQDLGTPKVQAASDHISAYFDAACPQS